MLSSFLFTTRSLSGEKLKFCCKYEKNLKLKKNSIKLYGDELCFVNCFKLFYFFFSAVCLHFNVCTVEEESGRKNAHIFAIILQHVRILGKNENRCFTVLVCLSVCIWIACTLPNWTWKKNTLDQNHFLQSFGSID